MYNSLISISLAWHSWLFSLFSCIKARRCPICSLLLGAIQLFSKLGLLLVVWITKMETYTRMLFSSSLESTNLWPSSASWFPKSPAAATCLASKIPHSQVASPTPSPLLVGPTINITVGNDMLALFSRFHGLQVNFSFLLSGK
jgi:hypothetical protein